MSEKQPYPGQFVVWITAMTGSYEDAILAGMVKKGYVVSVVASDGTISDAKKNNASTLISFRVDVPVEGVMAAVIHNNVLSILKEKDALYYSVIVASLNDACFIGTNIKLSSEEPAPIPPTPSTPNSIN